MFLIQILLPLLDNLGSPIPRGEFRQVRQELLHRFGGLTAYTQAPAEGLWKDEGDEASYDDIVIFEVMASELDREWWSDYRRDLEMRFRQETIVVRAHEIQML